ncbi:hypothetical protein [Methylobacterium indicum]|uniref:hypothetical protein n=1 Tax=Methylobacterium indicum TaxID=1775910 RepID=UPI002435AE6B|nr:hypothetical protein [Methylobacterium indicum]
MNTTIKLLDEADAMQKLGMRSHGRYVYAVQGDRVQEVIEWVTAEPLRICMCAVWDVGILLAAYIMFERDAQTEQRVKEINQALEMFVMTFHGADEFDWQVPKNVPRATKRP